MKIKNVVPVECYAWMDREGKVSPIQFVYDNEPYGHIQIKYTDKNRYAGNLQYVFACIVSSPKEEQYECELRFETMTCTWKLYKLEPYKG
ncbi:hypothetical protein HZI73_26295 (plasmid) [Vallitalea pronyensis]|uniref:Uncharacterized protein n=1 Tax=Vallitalea pronyensis TaxID=1348613 RepID=A0A8J8MQY8_9FIRM|nr:hypothetical protein [Vallitalea pronyensis]QUI25926.1 hypothetical protein HZI73_26295 [Vallitalea pronyensis]